MKLRSSLLLTAVAGAALLCAGPAGAVDHNNIDAGRPLNFDDAETIAFGEFAVEGGLAPTWPRRRALGLGAELELLYGVARNTHIGLGFDPSIGGRADSRSRAFSFGDLSLNAQHNFNRELQRTPATSLRGDLFFPTGRGSRGVGFRLRGIASKRAFQYGRFSANLDLNANPGAARSDRSFYPGFSLGYAHPLGYPKQFTQTGLARLGITAGPERGTGPVMTLGIGYRKQVTVRSVFDVGIESDVASWGGAPRDTIRLIIGYSAGFPTR